MKTQPLPNLADDPTFAAAAAKYVELQGRLNGANARHALVISELNAAAATPGRRVNAVESAAYTLLGIDGGAVSVGANTARLREEFADVTEDRQVLAAAVEIQKGIVANLRAEVSRRIIAGLLPAHRQMVRNIIKCVTDLDAALAVEHDLRDELFQRNIGLADMRAMPMAGFGRLADPNSRASAYLIEACEHGFIDISELPEKLQPLARAKVAKPTPAPQPAKRSAARAEGWLHA